MSTTGFEKRISALCPALSKGQVKKSARQLAHLADQMQAIHEDMTDDGYYTALRILGMHSDPTARDAIRSVA